MAAAPRQVPLGLRIGITVLLLGLFYFGARVPLPFVHSERLVGPTIARTILRVTGLGINSLLAGFLLVELGSLLLSAGRRLRAGGPAGRQKLNRIALSLSLAVSAAQGLGIALFLETADLSPGGSLVDEPGLRFRLILTLTLTAATAATYVVGNLITAWGIGNGFCLLWLVIGLQPVLNHTERLRTADDRTYLLFAVLVLASALLLRRVGSIGVRDREETLLLPLPALPQSIVPLNLASSLGGFGRFLPWLGFFHGSSPPLPTILFILLASPLFFFWVGSRRRILASLPSGLTLESGADAAIRRQLLLAIAFLAGVPLLHAAKVYFGMPVEVLSFPFLVVAVAIALDVYDHVRFVSSHESATLLELNDVHLAAYLERRLAAHGVPALVQGYQARSLFLLFQPLFKMDLLVPAERLDEARALVALEIEEELRVF
jgi:hypothetical protein